jgi:hypothetical protein
MSGYIGNIPVPQSTQVRETFIATASQTSFATAGYTPGFIDVYLNGVKLINGTDFTASNGSDVVLATGAAVSDTVEVVAYGTFETNSQTFTGVTTISELSDGTDTVETGYVVNGSAKAWVNFNGTGTIAIRGSVNVTSLTDIGVGRISINLTNGLSDVSNAVAGGQAGQSSSPYTASPRFGFSSTTTYNQYTAIGNTPTDAEFVYTTIHGDLA